MKHLRVVFQDDGKTVLVHEGATLLEAAAQAGIVLTTPCGGMGICGKCTVIVDPPGQRVLSCQYRVRSDLVVTVPVQSRYYECRILAEGLPGPDMVSPDVVERYRSLSGNSGIYGIAVDVGTTTVVAKLVNMADGRCLATQASLNPQTAFGDDVISRIAYARSDVELDRLHDTIVACLNDLIVRLCRDAGIGGDRIFEACVVGNTTMNHLLLGLPVEQLGQAPYRAYSVEARDIAPMSLGLLMNPAGNVHTVENVAGFVGSDTTAVAVAVDIGSASNPTLAVDIGTNGELVLAAKGQLYAASCAAGPALEGARIRQGSRAVGGAIEAMVVNEQDIDVDVIGGGPARTICGSGLVDAVAVLLELGVVDASGRFCFRPRQASDLDLPQPIASRLIQVDGQPAFCLASDAQGRPAVVLTHKDDREFQLAKGAIRAGIVLLMDKVGLDAAHLDRILLAGAFGTYIRPQSAVRVGLLPDIPLERLQSVGNAAASGAQMILLSQEHRRKASAIARRIQYVEIANEPSFQEVFAEAMFLKP
jgi:uncharacterized 2Fe-2S/4Fe-4S cluster protein (DUF4445 family)